MEIREIEEIKHRKSESRLARLNKRANPSHQLYSNKSDVLPNSIEP